MKILCHRGLWLDKVEQNSAQALALSINHGFGVETDIRDLNGRIVISHDPPCGEGQLRLDDILSDFQSTGLVLALNVKADGLSPRMASIEALNNVDWFAFDMSGPETLRFSSAGLPFFTRHSDIENPILYAQAQGVWLDSFGGEWYSESTVISHLQAGKRVCIVSPELHGRDPSLVWSWAKNMPDEVMVCTDLPHSLAKLAHEVRAGTNEASDFD